MTGLGDERIADLEAKTAAATPGPWVTEWLGDEEQYGWSVNGHDQWGNPVEVAISEEYNEGHDAAFIAAANPETVRALLEERRRLKVFEDRAAALVNIAWRAKTLVDRIHESGGWCTGPEHDLKNAVDAWDVGELDDDPAALLEERRQLRDENERWRALAVQHERHDPERPAGDDYCEHCHHDWPCDVALLRDVLSTKEAPNG